MLYFILLLEQLSDVMTATNETIDEFFKNASVLNMPPPNPIDIDLRYSKILLISDFHMGKKETIENDLEILFKGLHLVLAQEKPDVIFVLGDMVDGTCINPYIAYFKTVARLQNLLKPMYFLGGNHDRTFIPPLIANVNFTKFIHLITDPYMILPTNPRIFLAHDVLLNIRIRGSVVYNYASKLRKFVNVMRSDEYFCIGHAHTQLITDQNKTFSIGQFAPKYGRYEYATIQTKNFQPFITLKRLEPKNDEL